MARTIDRDARKVELAEAVWQVIIDKGISAVSVRTVAQQAGVVVGSLRHVFPTRAELLVFSAELMVQRATERVRAAPGYPSKVEHALEIVKHFLPLEPDTRAELEVNIALIAESPALPELTSIRDHAYRGLGDACLQIAEMLAGRPRDPALVRSARRLHALIDGLAIHLLIEASERDNVWAIEILQEELVRIGGTEQSVH
ncbi:TetR/AcrR family transcriptional regulator [Arthrobacter sp. CG_A4]|uniref:TetR/AcrR family transcriptional regulator n=1 Tax=Arthrobacter sp. CG_A4 TaxID=3071706 RepID=UPI002DFA9121|nr:AcrR family transcriptional regulator [Arthrobacter sp. CG_A4]